MSKELIVKDNKLIEAKYSLSTLQQKVLLQAIAKIEPTDTKHIYKFSIMEFAEAVDLKGSKTIYNQMATICDQLTKLPSLCIKTQNGGFIYINWVASAEYIAKEAVVEVEFSQKLMPYLIELKEQFTTYYLANIMTLKSCFSVRIFELLKQYEKLGKRKFELEELRQLVGTTELAQNGEIIKEEYPLYANFKSRVILPAQKELKQKTDIYFNFTEIKQGRKVVAIEFEILENTKNKKKIANSINFEQISLDIIQLQEEFKSKTKVEINYDLIDRLVKEKGYATVKKYIDNWDKFKHQTIKNVLGFFIVAVTQEFDIPTEQNQQKSYNNYEQRNYTEEELQRLYINYIEK